MQSGTQPPEKKDIDALFRDIVLNDLSSLHA